MNPKWSYVFFFLIAALTGIFFYNKFSIAPSISFDQLSLTTLESQPIHFREFKGKKTLVSFGASWCVNCIEELDMLQKIYGKELKDIQVIVISDESIEKIIRFKDKHAYPFVFLKCDTPFSELGINSIPTSYLLTSELEIKKEKVGELNWLDPSNRAHLLKLME